MPGRVYADALDDCHSGCDAAFNQIRPHDSFVSDDVFGRFGASDDNPLFVGSVLHRSRGPPEKTRDLANGLVFGGEYLDSIQFCCCPRLLNVWSGGVLHGAFGRSKVLPYERYRGRLQAPGTFDLDPARVSKMDGKAVQARAKVRYALRAELFGKL